jgi:hypothetical protein
VLLTLASCVTASVTLTSPGPFTKGATITVNYSGLVAGSSNPIELAAGSFVVATDYVSTASGQATFTAPPVDGTYVIRAMSVDGSTVLATSATFTVTGGATPSVSTSVTSGTILAGTPFTATYAGLDGDPANLLQLAATGAGSAILAYYDLQQTGSRSFTAPTESGSYVIRLVHLVSLSVVTPLASSAPFTVTLAAGSACTTSGQCASGTCTNGLCGAGSSGDGQTCSTSGDCTSGLTCVLAPNVSSSPGADAGVATGQCGTASLGDNQGFCNTYADCTSGLTCTSSEVCGGNPGDGCTVNSDCLVPSTCSNGQCGGGSGSAGSSCTSSGDCASGLVCAGGKCGNDNASCSSNGDCTSGLCNSLGFCGGDAGDVCQGNGDCLSNSCNLGGGSLGNCD